MFGSKLLYWFAEDANAVSSVKACNYNPVAVFVEKRGTEAVTAAVAGAFERIVADGTNALDAVFESAFDAYQVLSHFCGKFFQIREVAGCGDK